MSNKGMINSRRNFILGLGVAAGGALLAGVTSPSLAAQTSPLKSEETPLPKLAGLDRLAKSGSEVWKQAREHLRLKSDLTFLNNGTLGPASDYVLQTRQYYNELLAADPSDSFRVKELAEVRAQIAVFINAQVDEVSITHSTTEGLNIFAHGLDWKAGDEVILGDQEHFGATEPYRTLAQRYGIKIVTVHVPLPARDPQEVIAAYEKAFTKRTRVLAVSQVSYVTGLVAPLRELAELAHSHGALISVDGAQSFGVLRLDVQTTGIDHFAGAGQKWLLAGTGTGVNYIRKSIQPQVWPLYGFDDPAQKSSPRYERSGQLGIPAAIGISAALQFQNALGTHRIEERARQLGAYVRQTLQGMPGVRLLSAKDSNLAGNINVFTLANLPSQSVALLLARQEHIVIRAVNVGDLKGIRVSTHFYNTQQEIDRLFAVLTRWNKNPPQFLQEDHRTA